MSQFALRTHISNYAGYGLLGLQLLKSFVEAGHEVLLTPITLDLRNSVFQKTETYDSALVNRCIDLAKHKKSDRELVVATPCHRVINKAATSVFFTMWEASRLPRRSVANLNLHDAVLVPCEWNASVFNACGIDRPIHICPLGVDTKTYYPRVRSNMDTCVFGSGGRLVAGGVRKNTQELPNIFTDAFPHQKDVQLQLKTFPDEPISSGNDSRVEVINRFISPEGMAAWYAGLTTYISVSNSEGWGLMPHEAMAVGRPVMAPCFGGMREYFDDSVGYPLNFTLASCAGFYTQDEFSSGGHWAKLDRDDLIDKMRWIYHNQEKVVEMGVLASRRAVKYSWEAAHKKLEKTLKTVGFLT
jgi:glycosyltransferase involved in cell wall biosynthesis